MPPPSTPLSLDDTRKVARLARLALSDEQLDASRAELAAVLGYVERLRALDLTGVEPLSHPMEATNRLAADEPGPTIPNEVLMAMAPDALPPFVRVPRVIG